MSYSLYLFWYQVTHAYVVQEKKWLRAAGKNVVNAVINNVNTDSIVLG